MKPILLRMTLVISAFILLSALPGIGRAESIQGDPKIGVVDLEKVSKMAKPIQQTISSVEEALKPKKETVEQKLQQLDILRLTYDQQKAILSEEHRKNRLDEIKKLEGEITALSDEINALITEMEKKELTPAYDMVMKRIGEIAQKKGLTLVIPRDSVVWFDRSLDITDDLIDELNVESSAVPETEPMPKTESPSRTTTITQTDLETLTHDQSTTPGSALKSPQSTVTW